MYLYRFRLPEELPTYAYPKRPWPQEATAEAVLRRGLSPQAWRVLDWLSHGGVMFGWQLGVKPRTLRLYQERGLVTRLPVEPKALEAELQSLSWEVDRRRERALYVLGPLGLEIARRRQAFAPLTGYEAYPLSRIMHDVVVAEIVLRLARLGHAQGWEVYWAGTNAAELRRGQEQILEPDAVLVFRRGVEERAFCIEYHNEKGTQRGREKVRRYERAYREKDLWQERWDLETFPVVLAVAHDPAVLRGYLEALRERRDRPVTFYGKALSSLLQGNVATWKRIDTRQEEPLLPVPEPA